MPVNSRRKRPPAPSFPVQRFPLKNGLRVVLMPDSSAPTVAIAVVYDVGFRSEPEGMTGFAHLFEHLMFEGSVTLEKGQHDKLVTGNGGVMNGSTRADYTNYFEQLPSNALELGLYLEADRMRGLRLTDENVQNQIAVVKEEIRVNVVNQPFGGFPWILLPPVMFKTFANAHNGYGSFVDLEAATVDQASEFFDQYYAPGNATVVVAGDLDVDKTREMVERHFGSIPSRPVPPLGSFAEAVPTEERRGVHHDPLAPLGAVAVAYRVPDPINEFEDYVASAVLTDLLAEGTASRLYQRLVKRDQLATHVGGLLGTFGDPFDMRDPTMLQLLAYHPGGDIEPLLDALDEEVAAVTAGAATEEEVDRVVTTMTAQTIRRLDDMMNRALAAAALEQQRSRAELLGELPAALAAVTPDDVTRVAGQWLQPTSRAVLEVVPGGER
ncbi:MAG TPA: pitrilysin family protein [Acidimicrobiia bacterium]|jgi:predicted Zn-dependent peptidase|nr:pitrilysin family protein [Acidimicrobiia bacterium]